MFGLCFYLVVRLVGDKNVNCVGLVLGDEIGKVGRGRVMESFE